MQEHRWLSEHVPTRGQFFGSLFSSTVVEAVSGDRGWAARGSLQLSCLHSISLQESQVYRFSPWRLGFCLFVCFVVHRTRELHPLSGLPSPKLGLSNVFLTNTLTGTQCHFHGIIKRSASGVGPCFALGALCSLLLREGS